MMDVEQLHVVLQQSFSPDSNLRVPAEATIRNLKRIKGSTVLLLQVAAEKQVSVFNRSAGLNRKKASVEIGHVFQKPLSSRLIDGLCLLCISFSTTVYHFFWRRQIGLLLLQNLF